MGKSLKNVVTPDEMYDELRRRHLPGLRDVDGSAGRVAAVGDPGGRRVAAVPAAPVAQRGRRADRRADAWSTSRRDEALRRALHHTIDAVGRDYEGMRFNTAVAKLIELNNQLTPLPAVPRELAEPLVLMAAPMAPHLAEELWRRLGHDRSLAFEPFPQADPALLVDDTVTCVVQVAGQGPRPAGGAAGHRRGRAARAGAGQREGRLGAGRPRRPHRRRPCAEAGQRGAGVATVVVAVVTDSTATLTEQDVRPLGVRVVPLQVVVGGTAYDEGVEITSAEVATALRAGTPSSTSRPSPQLFLDAYTAAAEAGADSVVSLHISAALSGTYESAVLAARDSPVPTEVVDSRSMGMGLGYLVLQAARSAAAGQDARDDRGRGARARPDLAGLLLRRDPGAPAARWADPARRPRSSARRWPSSRCWCWTTGSSRRWRRSGRRPGRWPGSRTSPRRRSATARRRSPCTTWTPSSGPQALADGLAARLPGLGRIEVRDAGAVIGTHVGPGMVAVVVVPGP